MLSFNSAPISTGLLFSTATIELKSLLKTANSRLLPENFGALTLILRTFESLLEVTDDVPQTSELFNGTGATLASFSLSLASIFLITNSNEVKVFL